MKVVQVVMDIPPHHIGGTEVHAYHLSKALAELGVSVTLVHGSLPSKLLQVSSNGGEQSAEGSSGVATFRVPSLNVLGPSSCLMPTLPFLLRKLKPDIIHTHGYWNLYTSECGIISKLTKTPNVLTVHGIGNPLGASSFHKQVVNLIFDKSLGHLSLDLFDRVIAVSRHTSSEIIRRGVNNGKLLVVPNGIDLKEYSNLPDTKGFREEFCIKPDEKIILAIGRIVPEKGFQFLLRAMPEVLTKVRGCRLFVVGSDMGYRRFLETEVRRLNLKQCVTFLGHVSEEKRLEALATCSMVVVPSTCEPFSLVALEAMAAGKPLIATNAGGIPDVVGDSGILVDPRNVEQIAESVIRLLTASPSFLDSLVSNEQIRANQFSWDRIAKRVSRMYCHLLENGR